ncbi:MAG: hypothetical protein KF912_13950 [Phycisphaeraceae bacterium]|nr:hypothetical protein [Phycisphaeraceae bacterium]MBX3368411.1 hypothetical protein [Phycisphaeraceae bacterium]
MSEQRPTNDEQPEPPTRLPANAESVIQEDLARIRKRKRASSIACWVLLVLFFDVLAIGSIDYGVRNRTVLVQILSMGRHGSYSFQNFVCIYQTPQGMQVRPADEQGYNRLGLSLAEDPPPRWTPVAWAHISPIHFEGYGYGLLTPSFRECDYRLLVTNAAQDTVVAADDWRDVVCDWLEGGESELGERALRTGRALRKGDHVDRSCSFLCLLHDFVFVCAASWSVWTLIVGAVHKTPRAAMRIDRGVCPRCSYDLLADFSQGCPECAWGKERGGTS